MMIEPEKRQYSRNEVLRVLYIFLDFIGDEYSVDFTSVGLDEPERLVQDFIKEYPALISDDE